MATFAVKDEGRVSMGLYRAHDSSESDDDRPLGRVVAPPPPAASSKRPTSLFNVLVDPLQRRPSAFVKPAPPNGNASTTTHVRHAVPPDMQAIQQLYTDFQQKVYMQGTLDKQHQRNTDGSPVPHPSFTPTYAELAGPILFLWEMAALEGQKGNKCILPQFINVLDAIVELRGDDEVLLCTAGQNQYVLRSDQAKTWFLALRLAVFESSRLFEMYTRRFVTRTVYQDLFAKQIKHKDGFLQVRLPGQTGWRQYWTVACSEKPEKRLFGKRMIPCRGQLMFYESKRARWPVATLVNVSHAYCLYPEANQLIDHAILFKVQGPMLVTTNATNGEQHMDDKPSCGTFIMAKDSKELVQWLVACFDVFQLYGRPSRLANDATDPKSLNFAEAPLITPSPNRPRRLLLEIDDIAHLAQNDDVPATSYRAVLAQKLKQGFRATIAPTPAYTTAPMSPTSPVLPSKHTNLLYTSDSDDDDEQDDHSDNESIVIHAAATTIAPASMGKHNQCAYSLPFIF
ncbi:hypothetical protein BC940DRAFT_44789 [Gongronella butleri]|nr:hypothetical protein BC940DRAFT_44789 [Gongronella butleri]